MVARAAGEATIPNGDDIGDELAALLEDEGSADGATAPGEGSKLDRPGSDSVVSFRHGARPDLAERQSRIVLYWSGLLFLSFFLPVIVLYEPDSTGALGVVGSLGDTYYGAVTFIPLGVLGFLVALPVPVALWLGGRRSDSAESAGGSPTILYAALGTFILVSLPIVLLGAVFSLLPVWFIPSLAAKFGFRVDLGPGAWAALVSAAALVFVAADAVSEEDLRRNRLTWLRRTAPADGKLIAALAGMLVLSAGLRVIDWIRVDGTVDLIAPKLGKLGVLHHAGDGGVPAALLPAVSGVQFAALAILGLSLGLLWARSGVLAPLLAVLGGWGSFACAGVVAALNASWDKELHLDIGPVSSIEKLKVDAIIESVQPSVWLSMLAGLTAVALAIMCLWQQLGSNE